MTDLGHYLGNQKWWTFMRFGHCSIREMSVVWVYFSSNKPFDYDYKDGHLLDTRMYLKHWEIVWKWGLGTWNAWIVDIPQVWVTLPNHAIIGVKLSYKNRQIFPGTAYWFCLRYDIQFFSSFFSFFLAPSPQQKELALTKSCHVCSLTFEFHHGSSLGWWMYQPSEKMGTKEWWSRLRKLYVDRWYQRVWNLLAIHSKLMLQVGCF